MNTIVPPQRGDPPRASWAQAVTETVNSMLPFSAPGRLLRSGFGGTGSIPAPENKRQRQISGSASTKTPWLFVPGEDDESSSFVATGSWTNAMVQIGTEMCESGQPYGSSVFYISGLEYTSANPAISGNYYLVYNDNNNSWSVQAVASGGSAPTTSYANGIVVFFIGQLMVDSSARTITQSRSILAAPSLPLYL